MGLRENSVLQLTHFLHRVVSSGCILIQKFSHGRKEMQLKNVYNWLKPHSKNSSTTLQAILEYQVLLGLEMGKVNEWYSPLCDFPDVELFEM